MELCTKGLGSSVNILKQRNINLGCVRTCVVVAEERPRINLTTSFSKLFSALGLSPRAVSTSFGCRVNVAICLQVSAAKRDWQFLVSNTHFVHVTFAGCLQSGTIDSLRGPPRPAQWPCFSGGERQPSFSLCHGIWKTFAWGQSDHRQSRNQGAVWRLALGRGNFFVLFKWFFSLIWPFNFLRRKK